MSTQIQVNESSSLTSTKDGLNQIGTRAFLVPERSTQPELLDLGKGSARDVQANLTEMWRMNRAFGGVAALTSHLFPALRRAPKPLTLVDVGTGSAALPRYIAQWACQNKLELEIYAVDISGRNLDFARRSKLPNPNVHLVQADAAKLPFATNAVDYYISSLFLHHFAPVEVIQLLRVIYHHARRGIILSDLVRHYLPLAAFRLIQPVFARNYLTRHDGVVSIRRAYTPSELRMLAHKAGISKAQVFKHFPWRMTLTAEKAYD